MQESILALLIGKLKTLLLSVGAHKVASSVLGGVILAIQRKASRIEWIVIILSSALIGVGLGALVDFILGKFIPAHTLGKMIYLIYTTTGIISYDTALRLIARSPNIGDKIVDKGEKIIN